MMNIPMSPVDLMGFVVGVLSDISFHIAIIPCEMIGPILFLNKELRKFLHGVFRLFVPFSVVLFPWQHLEVEWFGDIFRRHTSFETILD